MATRLVVTEFVWLHSIAHPRIPPTRRKRHHDILHTSGVIACFVSNFVAMATRAGPVKIWLTSFDSPPTNTPTRRKRHRDIFYTRGLIACFVAHFVDMTTRVGRCKIWLTSFDSPTHENPLYLLYKPSYNRFCPKFRCHGNGGWSR